MNTKQRGIKKEREAKRKETNRGTWRNSKHEGTGRETEEEIREQNSEAEHSLNIFHGHTVNHCIGFDYQVGKPD